MEKKCLIIPCISLYCLLMGMFHNFCWSFGCQVRYGRLVFPFLLMAAMALLCVVQFKRKYAIIISAVGFLGLAAFCVMKFEQLTVDFLKIVHYINLRSEEYNGTLLFDFEGIRTAGTAMESNLFLRIVLLVCAVFISLFVFRLYSRGYGFLPVYGVMSLGLLVGHTPDSKAVSYLVVGFVLALMWVTRQEHGGRRFFIQKSVKKDFGIAVYFVFTGILLIGLVAARQVGKRQEANILKDSDKYLEKQHQLERLAKVLAEELSQYMQGKLSGESDGKLDNDEPHYTDSVVMKVTMTRKPSESIYLKGFIGAEYEDGEWFPSDNEQFGKIAYDEDKAKDIWNINYSFFSEYLTGTSMSELRLGGDVLQSQTLAEYDVLQSQILVEYVGKGKFGKYAYVPYFADVHNVLDEDSEECVTMDGENGILRKKNAYYVNFYPMGMGCYASVREQILIDSMLVSDFGIQQMIEYDPSMLDSEESLSHFCYVKNAYSKLPVELSALKHFIRNYEVGYSEDEEAVEPVNALKAGQDVARILKNQASYSMLLKPVPEGKDYAEYFLLEQKKGYCEHFATAGTLLLRAKGVAARFVQGYRVTPDMFEENDDGTYTAEILDSHAHAWTEVYEGKYAGWFPIEMTPGYEENKEATTRPSAVPTKEVVEATKKPKEKEEVTKALATKKPTASPEVTKKLGKGKNKGSGDGIVERIKESLTFDEMYVLLVAGMILILVLISRIVWLRYHICKRHKEFVAGAEDKKLQICIRTEKLLYFLKCCGQRGVERQNEEEWCLRASLLCKETCNREAWDEFRRIMQKAAFSVSDITDEEYEYYCDMAEKVELSIWQMLGKMRKCYLRILGLKK